MGGVRWQLGVAMGRFNPPHLGHVHLLATAAAKVAHLHVLLAHHEGQTIPATQRAAWLADAVADNVTIHLTPDDLPTGDDRWAERVAEVVPGPPDVAFTSAAWGPRWASAMRAAHVAVDPERRTVPVTSQALRRDLRAHFHLLVPAARAELARRITVVGAPRTGKTTIAHALARTLRTVWAPEHGRLYREGRQHLVETSWDGEELRRTADAQQRLVQDLARRAASGVILADTDVLSTAVWHRHHLGHDDAALDRLATIAAPDHYLVCAPDFADPDAADDPDAPHRGEGAADARGRRRALHEDTMIRVQASGVTHTVLEGPHLDRMVTALTLIDRVTTRAALT